MLQKWYRFVQVLLALLSCLFLCSTSLKAVSNNGNQATMEEEIPVGDVIFVTERKVNDGINFLAKTGVARPSSNFFTITPKWGYVPSSLGANGAVSSARGRTNDKKNTLIELEVRF